MQEWFHFKHPFTCIIAGPTQSGKTEFTKKLLRHSELYVKPPPERVLWCYGQLNKSQIDQIRDAWNARAIYGREVEFVEGIPSPETEFDTNQNTLLVLDDLMHEAGKCKNVLDLFTRKSHHQNLSVIMLVQNLFHQNKHMRDLMLNSKYLVLFKNPRDKGQIRHLAVQFSPSNVNFVTDAYHQATFRPHGYLIFDFDQQTPDDERLVTGIFPQELPLRYMPKKI